MQFKLSQCLSSYTSMVWSRNKTIIIKSKAFLLTSVQKLKYDGAYKCTFSKMMTNQQIFPVTLHLMKSIQVDTRDAC